KALAEFGAGKSLYYFVGTFTSQNPKSTFDLSKLILLLGGLCYTGGYFHRIGVWKIPLFTQMSIATGSIPLFKWNGNIIRLSQAPLLNLIANSPGEFFFCLGSMKQVYDWIGKTCHEWVHKNENEEKSKSFRKQFHWETLCLLTASIGRAIVFGHFCSNKVTIIFINAIRNNAAFAVSFAKKW
ncbi:MAG: hypothetical protein Q8K60_07010, partial [Parachlamydiaceae bacterium]|nr:hypothetical protein [Parachlamydiaceae bacterium]